LKVTVPVAEPKFVPVMLTACPTAPDGGEIPVISGAEAAATTVKFTPLLGPPLAVTTTFPDVAPEGTVVSMEESVQLIREALVPLNVTVPDVEPKFAPVIVTAAPIAPELGVTLLIVGTEVDVTTVKPTRLLATPFTVTTTFPDVAPDGTLVAICESDHVLTEAVLPLKVTAAAVEPKLLPVMMTGAPAAPEFGDRLVMVGPVGGGGVEDLLDELTPAHAHSRSSIANEANWARIQDLVTKGVFKFIIGGTRKHVMHRCVARTLTVWWEPSNQGRSQKAWMPVRFW